MLHTATNSFYFNSIFKTSVTNRDENNENIEIHQREHKPQQLFLNAQIQHAIFVRR